MKTLSIRLFFIVAIFTLTACSTMLPSGDEVVKSPWETFEEAKAAYDKIVPDETTVEGLRELGFDPYRTPNIRILNHLDVRSLFDYEPGFDENYHAGVVACMKAMEACQAYDTKIRDIHKERVGNFFLDVLVVKREEHRTGWQFHALILLVDDLVVYKVWSGNPMLDETNLQKNPLGPLQEIGPELIH
jgi:hypothetical protein